MAYQIINIGDYLEDIDMFIKKEYQTGEDFVQDTATFVLSVASHLPEIEFSTRFEPHTTKDGQLYEFFFEVLKNEEKEYLIKYTKFTHS